MDDDDILHLDQEYLKFCEHSQTISEKITFLRGDGKMPDASVNEKLRSHMLSLLQQVKTS